MTTLEKAEKILGFLTGVVMILFGLWVIHPGLFIIGVGAAICWLCWF